MCAVCTGRGEVAEQGPELCQLVRVVVVKRLASVVTATGGDMQANLKPLCVEGGCVRGDDWRLGVNVGGTANTLPVSDIAARGTMGVEVIELSRRSVVRVIVAGHDHYGFIAAREVPESRQRLFVASQKANQICEESLLFVGLRNSDFRAIYVVGLRAAKEQIV